MLNKNIDLKRWSNNKGVYCVDDLFERAANGDIEARNEIVINLINN